MAHIDALEVVDRMQGDARVDEALEVRRSVAAKPPMLPEVEGDVEVQAGRPESRHDADRLHPAAHGHAVAVDALLSPTAARKRAPGDAYVFHRVVAVSGRPPRDVQRSGRRHWFGVRGRRTDAGAQLVSPVPSRLMRTVMRLGGGG